LSNNVIIEYNKIGHELSGQYNLSKISKALVSTAQILDLLCIIFCCVFVLMQWLLTWLPGCIKSINWHFLCIILYI